MNPGILLALALGVLEILLGCSGPRRSAPVAPAPPPRVSTEVSVIPPQELKKGRPFVQFSGAVGHRDSSTPSEAPLAPPASSFNSDMQ